MEQQIDTDIELLEALAEGSERAYTFIYNKYAGMLYAFVFKLSKSEELTKDLVQDVFIKLWTNREEINIRQSFRSYLFAVAQHQLVDYFRRQVNQPKMIDYFEMLNDEPAAAEQSAEQLMDFDLFCKELERAKSKLTRQQRLIFVLCKEDNKKVAEVADLLNISEQSVRNQLSAATGTLRKELKDYLPLFLLLFCNI